MPMMNQVFWTVVRRLHHPLSAENDVCGVAGVCCDSVAAFASGDDPSNACGARTDEPTREVGANSAGIDLKALST